jgi:hypothetical protein
MRRSYYVYSAHRTRNAAESALEDYFANGEICEAEEPKIETQRRVVRDQTALYRTVYCVMFPCD